MAEPQPTATPTEGVAPAAQPDEGAQAPAGTPQEPPQQQEPSAQVDDTADWLAKKGYDPEDPELTTKLAKAYREAEKIGLKAAEQKASELKKSLTPSTPPQPEDGTQGDPMMQEFIQDYRRDKLIGGFKESHPDWNEYEPAMVEKLHEQVPTPYGKVTRSQLVNAGFMSLEDVYAMAKGTAPANTEQIKQQGAQETLQTLANTQRAGGGNAHASNSNPQAPADDPIMVGIKRSRGQ